MPRISFRESARASSEGYPAGREAMPSSWLLSSINFFVENDNDLEFLDLQHVSIARHNLIEDWTHDAAKE
jgi:hypothetical protein